MIKPKKNSGFTLMEVLLVIAIIGVIAAVTVPVMVAKTAKEKYVNNLKKINSTFTSITNLAQSSGAMIGTWNYDLDTTKFVDSYLIQNLNIAETCGTASGGGCFASSYKYRNDAASDIDGDTNYFKATLTDGNSIAIKPFANCTNTIGSQCVSFVVDVNGAREPNEWGKDVYEYEIVSGYDAVVPYGTFSGYNSSTKDWIYTDPADVDTQCQTGSGRYCALKIINDGWEINYF